MLSIPTLLMSASADLSSGATVTKVSDVSCRSTMMRKQKNDKISISQCILGLEQFPVACAANEATTR